MRLALLLALIACPAPAAAQTVWFVDSRACPGGGLGTREDPFCHIQDGIKAATAGDTVLVLPGLYPESIDFLGKAILVRSDLDGDALTGDPAPEVTLITGDLFEPAVTFANGEGRESILRGFTLYEAQGVFGGAIQCTFSSPSILGNILYRNWAEWGGGIYCEGGSPLIASNLLRQNSAQAGGGIYCTRGCSAALTNNTILANRAEIKGGAIACRQGARLFLRNSILWQNEASFGSAISVAGEGAWLRLSYSDVEGGEASVDVRNGGEFEWGEGNIDEDPQFANPSSDDFHLSASSPCVDAGERRSGIGELPDFDIDAEPRVGLAAVDMGADEFWKIAPRSFAPADSVRTVWFVDDDNLPGPGSGRASDPFVRIRDAIEVAANGDTVLVLPGVYAGRLDFRGLAITLRSDADGDPSTHDLSPDVLIKGIGDRYALVSFTTSEGRDSVLEGLTFPGAANAAIWCNGSSPTIRKNTFKACQYGIRCDAGASPFVVANSFLESGLGISSSLSSPTIVENVFQDMGSAMSVSTEAIILRNAISRCYRGIAAYGRALIVGNTLTGNESTGIYCSDAIVLSNVITAGSDASGTTYGGGIRVTGSSLIADNRITGNAAYEGGGISVETQGRAILRHNTILENTASNTGGGIFVGAGARPLIEGNTVAGNSAKRGGGITFHSVAAGTVQDNVIMENLAVDGAGIMCATVRTVEIRGNKITSNRASGRGGGIASNALGQLLIEGNELEGNTAERDGGAINCFVGGKEHIVGNRLSKNAAKRGGAVYLFGGEATLERNVFSSNEGTDGGAVYGANGLVLDSLGNLFLSNAASVNGGGICADSVLLTLCNNTFTRNQAGESGGGLALLNASQAALVNEILWEDGATTGEEIYVGFEPSCSTLSLSYSDLDLTRVFVKSGCTLDVGPGMITVDPLFVDIDGGDVSLSCQSACIDTGDPDPGACEALDLSDTPRTLDGLLSGIRRTDMGAREFAHVHLEVEGTLEAGGLLRLITTGTAGLFVFLCTGTEQQAVCLEPFGPLFLDPAQASWLALGAIPDQGRLELELPVPDDLVLPARGYLFQDVGVTPGAVRGNISNPVSTHPIGW
ncbi:MAG: right-handed parallel beta-helix repeat-containing protein [Planctomycetota bacterium]